MTRVDFGIALSFLVKVGQMILHWVVLDLHSEDSTLAFFVQMPYRKNIVGEVEIQIPPTNKVRCVHKKSALSFVESYLTR